MASSNKRGNPGLKGQLIDKSIEAYILALETINRLSIKYRVETFLYLICNSWELLLKARIIDLSKNRNSIFYKPKPGEKKRSFALRDCVKKIYPNENEPIRKNLEYIADLRDESVHLVISQVSNKIMSLFQSSVLNFHNELQNWFGLSLSDRVPIGMMTIIFDFNPEKFDLTTPLFRKQWGKEVVEFLTGFEKQISSEYEQLNHASEFSININYKLALVKKPGEADIVLSSGNIGSPLGYVEIAKDPCITHPFSCTNVTEQVNLTLDDRPSISLYDIQCVINHFEVKKNKGYYYKGTFKNSPTQYSQQFLNWLVDQYKSDPRFFIGTRKKVLEMNRELRRNK